MAPRKKITNFVPFCFVGRGTTHFLLVSIQVKFTVTVLFIKRWLVAILSIYKRSVPDCDACRVDVGSLSYGTVGGLG